ncbi:MAG: hypothetical protein ACR2H4_21000 [Pyrinomonadaceae bacterium]
MAARETGQPAPITSELAGRVYGLLLRGYPTPFRSDYGKDMAQLFRDCYLREKRRGGLSRLGLFWFRTLLDFMRTVPREHLENLGKENSNMRNLGRDAIALLGCIGIILAAFFLLSYGRKHEASSILMFGYVLDALVITGVIGNLIVFLLAKTTRLDPLRVALWTSLILNAVPAILLAIIGSRIDPQFRTTATLVGYAVSFLFWFGVHWVWSQTKGSMQPAN